MMCVVLCVEDGTVITHTIRRGTYMRTLRPPVERGMTLSVVDHVVLSDVGHICVLSTQTHGKATKQVRKNAVLYVTSRETYIF